MSLLADNDVSQQFATPPHHHEVEVELGPGCSSARSMLGTLPMSLTRHINTLRKGNEKARKPCRASSTGSGAFWINTLLTPHSSGSFGSIRATTV